MIIKSHKLPDIDKKKQYEIAFIACIFAYIVFYICDFLIKGLNAIQWSTLWNGHDFIADFTNVIGYSSDRDPYGHNIINGLEERAYPPLQYLISYFLSKSIYNQQHFYDIHYDTLSNSNMYIETKTAMLYLLFIAVSIISLFECIKTYKNGSKYIKTLTAFAVTLSYPIIFIMERGNSILAVFVFVLFYLCFYNNDNKILRELSFISLALAAAFKLTPALLGIFLVMEKRWKEAFRTIIYGIVLFLFPFLFFKGGFNNIPLFFRNLSLQLNAYSIEDGCTIKGYFIYYFPDLFDNYTSTVKTICSIATVLICILFLLAAFITKRKCDRLLYICLVLIILPSHSGTYCIVYIIPALLALLNEENKKSLDKYIILGGCFCLCELGGDTGSLIINYHNGLLIIVLCSLIKSTETIIAYIQTKSTNKEANLIY